MWVVQLHGLGSREDTLYMGSTATWAGVQGRHTVNVGGMAAQAGVQG